MQRFDCLARDCPLLGPHLLEASAGTGKTFSIEHIFVRLILESIELEQILVVTFTRAATRELKARIRLNLERALEFIQSREPRWDYLHPYLGSPEAIRSLSDALAAFDRCQIFTIHGFCYRMLQQFAFEAKVGSLTNPDEGKKVPQRLRQAALDFLQHHIKKDLLCPEQISLLMKEFKSMDAVVDRLLLLENPPATDSFSALYAKCKAALHFYRGPHESPRFEGSCIAALHFYRGPHESPRLEEQRLLEDFRALEKGYKAEVKGNFEAQIKGLFNEAYFGALLKEKGSVFDFLSPENRKVKAQDPPPLHYPGFFDWARKEIAPLFKQKIFPVLQAAWNPMAEKILAEEEHVTPDEILLRMKKAMEHPPFAELIREKYKAAIIDEFQDTDALQWDIFHRLFFDKPMRAVYLVGDPKQSIYRFRKADVYTYLKARDFLGEEHIYQLDTNFRSSKELISALNALFCRNFLPLPKAEKSLPYHPVRAGASLESDFNDGKGAIHFFTAEGEPHQLLDDVFIPYAVQEIERLSLKRCALLVKDRYQAQKALDLFKERGIAAVAKSHMPLGQTVAFQAIRELFEAILSPRDASAEKVVLAGPFAKADLALSDYRALLEERGLVPFAREWELDLDGMQVFELLFEWEKREGFSFEGLKRQLKFLQESDEEGKRRMEVDEEAVQIMTLHISKGLEFDVVFALGLISRTPAGEEADELDAEKLRQLYVAMTRAKKRLYIPLALSQKETEKGTQSPLELFARYFEGSLLQELSALSKTESMTIEEIQLPLILGPPLVKEAKIAPPRPSPRPYTPSFLSSFTILAKTKESEWKWSEQDPGQFTLQTMPRGTETGIVIHEIFEALFGASQPIWRNPAQIDALVAEQLRFSPLGPWQKAIQQMVRQTVQMPLQAGEEVFSLNEIDHVQVEMEFVFSSGSDFIKGFIDLVFIHREKVYFVDWKTNWLENYSPANLQSAIEAHDYGLQANLYGEAIRRHFQFAYGGAFYLFVRGGASFFIPGGTSD